VNGRDLVHYDLLGSWTVYNQVKSAACRTLSLGFALGFLNTYVPNVKLNDTVYSILCCYISYEGFLEV
jgi:hypothetical protein